MQDGVRCLYYYVMHGLKMEKLNEEIINLTGTYALLINILIILVAVLTFFFFFGLSLKKLFCLTAKIQILEKLNKIDHGDIMI